jgi:hypothetical protein
MRASGLVRVRTQYLKVPPGELRRKLPRPSVRFSLALLAAGLLVGGAGALHRRAIDRRLAGLLVAGESAPFEIQRIRRDLADLEVDEHQLSDALAARLKYAESLKARDFYIVIDTKARRMDFKYADRVVRSAPIEIGAPATVTTKSGKRWTFAPVTGAFSVRQKLEGASWKAPEWAYALRRRPAPEPLPDIPNGLGRYVLVFADGYALHSPPPAASPLAGAKPGSFLVPEADLAAIWKRVGPETRIYVF